MTSIAAVLGREAQLSYSTVYIVKNMKLNYDPRRGKLCWASIPDVIRT